MKAAGAFPQPTVAREAAPGTTLADIIDSDGPVILRGLVAGWPVVAAAGQGFDAFAGYLRGFDAGRDIVVYRGGPDIAGRFFYDAALTGMNYTSGRMPLPACLEALGELAARDTGEAFYVGSTDLDRYLPGLAQDNPLPIDTRGFLTPPLASLWMGTRTVAATHFDMSNNIACCVAGRRRFTLFPPDQASNLYPGPIEPTPGGQVVSMVDLRSMDLDRYPRFAEALGHAIIADLAPGDVLVYPALWWHNVEAFESFNVLINYWWNAVPAYVDTPWNTLLHGLLSLRERPLKERQAWRALFDHYLFGPADLAAGHLPDAAKGPLGPLDDITARRLRAQLLNRLNR